MPVAMVQCECNLGTLNLSFVWWLATYTATVAAACLSHSKLSIKQSAFRNRATL